jgi:hypothetical protein
MALGMWSNPGGGEATFSYNGHLYRRYGDGPIQDLGPDPNASSTQPQTPAALTQGGAVIPPNASGVPGSNTSGLSPTGGMTPSGSTPSVSAINKVVEPDPNTTSGGGANAALMALNDLTGGGGAVGNQEQTGSVSDQTAGMFRALGRRNQPDGSLKLNRKAY